MPSDPRLITPPPPQFIRADSPWSNDSNNDSGSEDSDDDDFQMAGN